MLDDNLYTVELEPFLPTPDPRCGSLVTTVAYSSAADETSLRAAGIYLSPDNLTHEFYHPWTHLVETEFKVTVTFAY